MKLTKVQIKNTLFIASISTCCIVIFFFSWLPNPSFNGVILMPKWLVTWTDKHGILRTAIPFIPLSFVSYVFLRGYISQKYIAIILFLIILIAETGQLFTKFRVFDIMDILLAGVGITIGWILYKIILLLRF